MHRSGERMERAELPLKWAYAAHLREHVVE